STKLETEPPVAAGEDERVDLHLPRVSSCGQPESVLEQLAKHRHLEVATGRRCRRNRAGARHDVEPFVFGPARQANYVRPLNVVSEEDQVAWSDIAGFKAHAGQAPHERRAGPGLARAYRGDLECNRGGRLLPRRILRA